MSKNKFRTAMSVALVLALASVLPLNPVAASNKDGPAPYENMTAGTNINLLNVPSGRLRGTGRIMIDDNEAQAGSTVLSGSVIATGQDSFAQIDLNALGHIELRPNTAIRLTLSAGRVEVGLNRGSVVQALPAGVIGQLTRGENTRLGVIRGAVNVKSNGQARTLEAGEAGTFNQTVEALTSGDALITADDNATVAPQDPQATSSDDTTKRTTDEQQRPRRRMGSPGWLGVLIFAGVVTAVTTGIVLGSNRHSHASTQPRPSTVVP